MAAVVETAPTSHEVATQVVETIPTTQEVVATAPSTEEAQATIKEPARPQNAYWLWLAEVRPALAKEAAAAGGHSSVAAVGKLAGPRWKTMTAEEKAPFDAKVAVSKAAYDKAMEEFLAQGGVKGTKDKSAAKSKKEKAEEKKAKAEAKEAKAKAKDPNRPVSPQTSYFLWMTDSRQALMKEVGQGGLGGVAKLGGERWKTMAAESKAPYETKAADLKAAYTQAMQEYKKSDAYTNAMEKKKKVGVKDKYEKAKMDVYRMTAKMKRIEKARKKTAQLRNAARDEYEKVKPALKKPTTPTKSTGGKRASKPTPPKATKKARTDELASAGVKLEDSILAEAGALTESLNNLAMRPEMSGKSGKEMLEALRACEGLVNKAKEILLGQA